jgi:hypothetical protein
VLHLWEQQLPAFRHLCWLLLLLLLLLLLPLVMCLGLVPVLGPAAGSGYRPGQLLHTLRLLHMVLLC